MTAHGWTLDVLWRRVTTQQPHRTALIHGDRAWSWAAFDAASGALAGTLHRHGVTAGEVVALCLPNIPEHLVCFAAVLRLGATPAQLNPRYRARELDRLLRLLDPTAVIYDPVLAPDLADLHARRQACREVPLRPLGDHRLHLTAAPSPALPSPEDTAPPPMMIKCTGGTTGSPQAVLWRVSDVLDNLNAHNPWARHDLGRPPERTAALRLADARIVIASPLSHGSGLTRAMGALCAGGAVITVPGTSFDPDRVLDAVARHRADTLAIVGDAYARPLAGAAHSGPDVDLAGLRTITSSGARWTAEVKYELLAAAPHVSLVETFGATEATGLGSSLARPGDVPPTGHFDLGDHARVFGTDNGPVSAGAIGRIGVCRPLPAGLHPQGSLPAQRYLRTDDGRTYLLSGDLVRLLAGKTIALLGREQDCINTGGEKVHASEVTTVLLAHPHVVDAAVLAVPDARLGSTVGAVLHLHAGSFLDQVLGDLRSELAGYKIPRVVRVVPAIPRTPVGKVDLVRTLHLLTDQDTSA